MKRDKKIYMISILIFACAGGLNAQETSCEIVEKDETNKWYKPDYFKMQYAGNIGFMSLGLGYTWWRDYAQSSFMYGYVPYDEGEAVIHTFTVKNTFRLYRFNIADKYNLSPTLGFSLSLEPEDNSYLKLPEKYPEGYYGPNCFYSCINLGLRSNFKFKEERHFSSIDVFGEFNTLVDYIYYNIIAKEDRSNNIGSVALGVNVFF